MNWEMIGVILAAVAAIIGFGKWAFNSYAKAKVKDVTEDAEIKSLRERIEKLEAALVKQSEQALALSESLHTHLTDAVIKIAGTKNEQG